MHTMTSDAGVADAFDLPLGTALAAEPAQGIPLALNPTPTWTEVLREQIAAVGLAFRREGLIAAGCALAGTAVLLWIHVAHGPLSFPLTPKMGMAPALMALLLPMAVWKDEPPSQRGYHQAMPMDFAAHATARSLAGMAWMLAALVALFGWMGLLSVATEGRADHAAPWQWLAPFVAVIATYLLGSALTLVSARPARWLGGGIVGYVFLHAFSGVPGLGGLVDALDAVFTGRFGLGTLLLGMTFPEGGPVNDLGAWLVSVCLWLGVAVGAFALAAHRPSES